MKKAILLYDSECSFCTRFKSALERIDSNQTIDYKSIYDKSVYIEYPQLKEDECHDLVHLIDESGTIYQGAEVIEYLVDVLPGVSKFAWLLDSDSAKNAVNVFYKKINDLRIMKKRNCYTCGSKVKKRNQ